MFKNTLTYIFILSALVFTNVMSATNSICYSNNCISFTVSVGTGCAWMCSYCANQLGTNNYYFKDNICTYQPGGCVGNPLSGINYTCCST